MQPVPAAWADSQNLQLFFICHPRGGVSRLEPCTGSAFQHRCLCRSTLQQPPPASLRYHLQRTKGRCRSWTQIKGTEEQKTFDLLSVGPLQRQTKITTKTDHINIVLTSKTSSVMFCSWMLTQKCSFAESSILFKYFSSCVKRLCSREALLFAVYPEYSRKQKVNQIQIYSIYNTEPETWRNPCSTNRKCSFSNT